MIIINADDFGKSQIVNSAIKLSFARGLCSSATIMANMPGFEEACQIVSDCRLNDYVGLHFVLTEGMPLTDEIKRQKRFCDQNGQFRISRNTRLIHLTTDEKISVANEMRSQFKRCKRHGMKLTHLDSHHHIHEEIGIMRLLVPLIHEFGIPNVRIMNNMSYACRFHRRVYVRLFNAYLKYHCLNRTDYFGSIEQYVRFQKKYPGFNASEEKIEIMTHPTLNREGRITDAITNINLKQFLAETDLRIACAKC